MHFLILATLGGRLPSIVVLTGRRRHSHYSSCLPVIIVGSTVSLHLLLVLGMVIVIILLLFDGSKLILFPQSFTSLLLLQKHLLLLTDHARSSASSISLVILVVLVELVAGYAIAFEVVRRIAISKVMTVNHLVLLVFHSHRHVIFMMYTVRLKRVMATRRRDLLIQLAICS